MKQVFAFRVLFFGLLVCALPSHAQTPAGPLVVDQAAVVPPLLTIVSGSIVDVQVVRNSQGEAYVAEAFNGVVQYGNITLTSAAGSSSSYDIAVAKLNAAGGYQWVTQAGGTGSRRCRGLAVDAAGNAYITGAFTGVTASFGTTTLVNAAAPNTATSDAYVAKVSAAGAWQWANSAGGGTRINGNDGGTAVAADVLGNVYVAGTYSSSVAFFGPAIQLATTDTVGGGRATVFVAKLSPTGVWQWARRGEYYGGLVKGLVADAAANVYLASQTAGAARFGPFTVTDAYGARSLVVAKLDGNGAWQWLAHAPGSYRSDVNCTGLALGGQHDLYFVGNFDGDTVTFGQTRLFNHGPLPPPPNGENPYYHTTDAYVARLDTRAGAWRWAVQSQGDGYEGFNAPLLDGAGHLYASISLSEPSFQYSPSVPGHVFGNTRVTVNGMNDIVVAKLDTAGGWDWVQQAGGSNDESASPLYADAQSHVYLGGAFYGPSLTLGAFTLLARAPGVGTGFISRLTLATPLAGHAKSQEEDFSVYPNPAHGTITIVGAKAGQVVRILDVLGRQVMTGMVSGRGDLHLTLPPGLPAGLYIVRAGAQVRRFQVV